MVADSNYIHTPQGISYPSNNEVYPQFYDNGLYMIPEYVKGTFQKETKINMSTGNRKIYWSLLNIEKEIKKE